MLVKYVQKKLNNLLIDFNSKGLIKSAAALFWDAGCEYF